MTHTVILNDDLDETFSFDSVTAARRFARAQMKAGAGCYEITQGDEYGKRIEYREAIHSDDHRVLQGLGLAD